MGKKATGKRPAKKKTPKSKDNGAPQNAGPPWFVDEEGREQIARAWDEKTTVEAELYRLYRRFKDSKAQLETRLQGLDNNYQAIVTMTARRMGLPPNLTFNKQVMAFTPQAQQPNVVPPPPPSVAPSASEGSEE